MGRGYVLSGLSEETRDKERAHALEEERAVVRDRLHEVEERLEVVSAKRRGRMEREVFYARKELGRIKQQMSEDPYGNKAGWKRRDNARNRSSVAALAFNYPCEAPKSSSQSMLTPRLLAEGADVNGKAVPTAAFGRPRGEFTDYLTKAIQLRRDAARALR